MARGRFTNLDEARQEAILRGAAEEFAQRGYAAASVGRIAARAGLSKGALYYYFDDKADLLATVVETAVERAADDAGWTAFEDVDASAFWDTLLALARRTMEYVRRNEWWVLLLRAYQRILAEAPAGAPVHRLAELERGWWDRIIERGRRLGVVRDDAPADLLVAMAAGADRAGDRWLAERWGDLDDDELHRIVDVRVDLIRDMLSKEHEGWE